METENKNERKKQSFLQIIQESILWKYSKLITGSATFALILSIIFFVWETLDSQKTTERITSDLTEIQQSLSTRYLGIFPKYIGNTNEMLRKVLEKKEDFSSDTIVVFEDVLYYGVTSDPQGFKEVNDKLLQLADKGAKLFVVYYKQKTALAVKNLRERLFSPNCYRLFVETQRKLAERTAKFQKEMFRIGAIRRHDRVSYSQTTLMDSLANIYFSDIIQKEEYDRQMNIVSRTPTNNRIGRDVLVEMILNERFFSATRDENHDAFVEMVNKYCKPIVNKDDINSFKRQSWQATMDMCRQMDNLRAKLIEQPYDSICFEDFAELFGGYTEIMEKEYAYHRNITLIPIEDYLTMSCWMVGNKYEGYDIIIAFPNRFSSSEIGFASQDDNIAQYIHTMLEGITANYSPN